MATLIAPQQFSPVEDAEILRKAAEGWGTNEEPIIQVLAHRTAEQRRQIRLAYQDLYQEDLVKRLESELSGEFEKVIYRLLLDPADRDAVIAHVAVKKAPNHLVVAEAACVPSPDEFLAVKKAYHFRYKRSLEEDVAENTTGDIGKLLVALVSTYRYHGEEINAHLAHSEAKILHEAIQGKNLKRDEIIRIIGTRSKAQLNATFNKYRDDHGISFADSLLGDPKDEFSLILHTAVRCIFDHLEYFEKVLRNAIGNHGTDEDSITRVVVTRAEKDLLYIKEEYKKNNSVTLDHAIAKGTSGKYKELILALLGNQED